MSSATTKKTRRIDDIFELDLYQLIVLAFNEFMIYTMLSNVVFNMFGVATPKLVGCDDIVYNGTAIERCVQYDEDYTCMTPQLKYEFASASVEFTELCNRHESSFIDSISSLFGVKNRARFSTTSQMLGIMVGSAVAGQLSDLYGRKKITTLFLALTLFFSTGSSFSTSIDVYVIFRFFIGFAGGGLNTVGSIFVIENLPSGHRLWMSTVITWAPNYMLFALFAYLTQEWRMLARVNNVMTFTGILVILLLPESPKYLVQKGKKSPAIEAIKYINKFKNKKNRMSHNEIVEMVEDACAENRRRKSKNYSFVHLYTHPKIALQTLVASASMFSISYVTYALLFNYDVITGSLYLNTAISGLIRYIVGAIVAVVDHFSGAIVGRKRMHFTTMTVIMLCMFSIFFIYFTDNVREYRSWIRIFTLLAFGTTGCLFLQLLLVTAELFPTGIRNIASAHINVCGRLGNLFGPMIFAYTEGKPSVAYLVLTLMCLADVILFGFFIPETKNQPLPSEMPKRKKKNATKLATIEENPAEEEPLAEKS